MKKKILALIMASVMVVSSSTVAFAEDGSKSVTAKDIEQLQNEIDSLNKQIEILTEVIKAQKTEITINNDNNDTNNNNPTNTNENKPTNTNNPTNNNNSTASNNNQNTNTQNQYNGVTNPGKGGGSSSSGSGGSSRVTSSTTEQVGNYVNYNGSLCYPVKKIEINGAKSNATFMVAAPDGGTVSSAKELAASLGGSLINTVTTSSPGVNFATAKVNFFVDGVVDNDNIAVYQLQNGKWVQLSVSEIRKEHVFVNMTRHGVLAFIRVPALAST